MKISFLKKDGCEQLVIISFIDGDTFIVDRHAHSICFRPPLSSNTGCAGDNDSISSMNPSDQIQAFTCGLFGDNNMFCFIYVLTHNDKIMIVHSIELTNTNTTNLLSVLDEKYKDGKLRSSMEFFSQSFFLCLLVVTKPDELRNILHPSH